MERLAAFCRWLGRPFRAMACAFRVLINLTQTQIRALFSLGMLGGIVALSFQNTGLIVLVRSVLKDASPGSLFGEMALNQQFWNNVIMGGFGLILGLVVFGADYFRAKINQKEIEFGNKPDKETTRADEVPDE